MSYQSFIYTKTDESPALATYSLLPIIKAFVKTAGINVELKDISLAGRILARFPEYLEESQRQTDDLEKLGQLAKTPSANIIKLPNISASIPQLKAAIKELQGKGYKLPSYPQEPVNEVEKDIKFRYDKIKGSAVNPVLREGNSDRRAPAPVKQYAKNHPHSMGEWKSDSKTQVVSMATGDFYDSERSVTITAENKLSIKFVSQNGEQILLRDNIKVLAGEVIDGAFMSKKKLRNFLEKEIETTHEQNILLSLHLKATMMKVSDPIIFGHAVSVYYRKIFEKHASTFKKLRVNPNNGLGDLYERLRDLPTKQRQQIEKDIEEIYKSRPDLSMVDSDKGITNLHVPSHVIIDASMPALIRLGGKMWGADGRKRDTRAIIPDRSYSGVYLETIDFCKKNGAFDPSTMGSVSNVGLMAQKAEEYGSHDKTFEIPKDGTVTVIDSQGQIILEHKVEEGDIWRMCQAQDAAIKDWVSLAVRRGKESGDVVVFWLDENRPHDAELIKKVEFYLKEFDTSNLEIHIKSPTEATKFSLARIKSGKNTISATGNVLRDYLTDLFPILELGTSAKMLSIVPLMKGGGLFETGAGGSAPKQVEQFLNEGHLRWDSLGEFLALSASLSHLSRTCKNAEAGVLAKTLDNATAAFLENNKSPSRKTGELDNRGCHFYLAFYWAQELGRQTDSILLKDKFMPLSKLLIERENQILRELNGAQGESINVGGYYHFDEALAQKAMTPSKIFNEALKSIL